MSSFPYTALKFIQKGPKTIQNLKKCRPFNDVENILVGQTSI